MNAREVLNKIKWTKDISQAKIYYVSRGSPGNCAIKYCDDVTLEKSFIVFEKAHIPYHRVTMIEYEDKVVFDRMEAVK